MKIHLAALLAVVSLCLSPSAAVAQEGHDREHIVKRFDKDGDGQLNEEEKAAAREWMQKHHQGQGPGGHDREHIVKKFDKDGDGQLNEEEKAAAREWMQQQGHDRPRGEGEKRDGQRPDGQKPDGARPGLPPGIDRDKILKKFDKDGDGRLNDAERAAAREWLRHFHRKRQRGEHDGDKQ